MSPSKWGPLSLDHDRYFARGVSVEPRARIMGARYPFYLLADSRDGQIKEAEITHAAPSAKPVHGSIRHGFVYERVPHIALISITNKAEGDVIWEQWLAKLAPLRG